MKLAKIIALALFLSACSHHAGSSEDGGATGSGQGHLQLSGLRKLDHDFTVDQCTISPPGTGLINGYQAIMKSDAQMETLSVKVPNYVKDDTYHPPQRSREEQVGAMMHAQMGPIMLSVAAPNGSSSLLMETPASKITITVSDRGLRGEAKFDNFEDQAAAMNQRLQALSQGKTPNSHVADSADKTVSGTITWTCPEVKHLNGGAVNSMFNKLIPPNK